MLGRELMQRDCLGDEIGGVLPHDTGEQVGVPEAGGTAPPVERVRAHARVADGVDGGVEAVLGGPGHQLTELVGSLVGSAGA